MNPAILTISSPPHFIQQSGPIPQREGSDLHGASLVIKSQLSKTNLLTMAKQNEEGWKHRWLLPSFYPSEQQATLLAPREFEGHANPQLRVNFGLTVKRRLAVFSSIGSRRENVSLLQRLPA